MRCRNKGLLEQVFHTFSLPPLPGVRRMPPWGLAHTCGGALETQHLVRVLSREQRGKDLKRSAT